MLAKALSSPDYVNYLTYIFTSCDSPQLSLNSTSLFTVRYSAAINLKNYIKTSYETIPKSTLSYIKASVVSTLQDTNPQLRSFAGTVITEIVQKGGLLQWPEILQNLLSLASNEAGNVPPEAQEGAMSALSKVCEDNRKLLDRDFQGQRPTTVLVPKLLDLSTTPNTRIRLFALKTLKLFIPQKTQALLSALDAYLTTLFQLANHSSTEIRRIICQSLVQLVETRPDMLAPHLTGLVDYVLVQQQNRDDSDLALDAAEFWLSVGEQEELRDLMGPYLQTIIPVLLQSMVYDEESAARLSGDVDDADEDDRDEDLKPHFAQVRAGRTAAGTTLPNEANGTNGYAAANGITRSDTDTLSEGEVEEEEEEEEDWEDDDPEDQWSLRKCSAAALDVFAVNFHQPVFQIILPYLRDNLNHSEWPRREAAVLALGAIADGCMNVVAPHLAELVPFLISLLSDQEPVVRQITSWCLGRYSEWASHLQTPADLQRYFEPMMEGLLKRMLDQNKKVQEAAASAFASLEEKAGNQLTPYTQPILLQFVECFRGYKDKNMYILYDCVQTLAENVGAEMARPELIEVLMPVLVERWNKIMDQSKEVFPLLGCLGYVAAAYGDAFSPFASPIFTRCINIVYQNLKDHAAVASGHAVDEPDKDFVVTSLDLISAIVQAIDPAKSGELVTTSQPQFFELLAFCMEDPTTDVKQSAYALLGDCAITIYPQLEPFLPRLMPLLANQLNLDLIRDEDSENGLNVLNNVCWSCGELGAKAGSRMAPYIDKLYKGLILIMKTEDVPDSVNENASLSLGRLGIGCPEQLAGHLSEIAEPFLGSMTKIQPTQEKASAFLGFNRVVEKNPRAMEASLHQYFTAIAMFPKRDMAAAEFGEVRQSFGSVSSTLQSEWSATKHRRPGPTRLQGANPRFRLFSCAAASSSTAKAARYIPDMSDDNMA